MSDFRSAMLKLPDEAFFELVRNYLGPIKTPFNKHDLIGKVESMLRGEQTQSRIRELLDRNDKEVLSAIWLLGEPEADELFDFFAGRRSYLELHHHLLNLEDRLLIYRDENVLRLTPILKPMLEESALDAAYLFESRAATSDEIPAPQSWLSDSLLASFLSFCIDESDFLRADGHMRKRVLNRIRSMLPDLAAPSIRTSEYADPRAAELYRGLNALGLVGSESETRFPAHRWEALASESAPARVALIASGWVSAAERMLTAAQSATIAAEASAEGSVAGGAAASAHGSRGLDNRDVRLRAEAIEAVWTALPQEAAISVGSVDRLLASLLGADHGSVPVIRQAMILFGILWQAPDHFGLPAPVPTEALAAKPIIIQPDFGVTLPQEVAPEDAFFLAKLARLSKHDIYPRFELAKERLAMTLHEGVVLDEAVSRLSDMSQGTIPQNVVMIMKSWGSEFESMRLYRGIVLTIEASRRFIVEQPAVARLIRKELASGVYLIAEHRIPELRSALADSGVELLPEVEQFGSAEAATPMEPRAHLDRSRLTSLAALLSQSSPTSSNETSDSSVIGSSSIIGSLRDALSEAGLSSEQRQEIATRIDRKLILSSEQIRGGSLRQEKNEARGIDYGGKVRIIEQAIRSGTSFLDVVERTEDGSPLKYLIEPLELQKEKDELYLAGLVLPDRTEIKLRVRKLVLVRRIRGGLVRRRL